MSAAHRGDDGRGEKAQPPGQSRGHGRSADAHEPEEISFLRLAGILLRHRRLLLLVPVAVAVFVVGVTFFLPRDYTATSSFTPHGGESQVSRLAGLASQFGISIPQGEVGQSPQFYADLLRGRELLRQAVVTRYEVSSDPEESEGDTVRGDLVDLLGVDDEERPVAVANAVDALQEKIRVSSDPETGLVTLSVTSRWPDLSLQLAKRMIELVNRFNLESRKTQAAAERDFIESQLARAKSTLHAAEDSLEAFLERNRSYQSSPELTFRYERLQRQVTLRQQLFTSLSQSYQQAKIAEVRNTPVITVVEAPEMPARPDSRQLALKGVLGLVLGGIVSIFWSLGREVLATSRRRDPDDYAEFVRLKAEAKEDVIGFWRRLRRALG